jgi:hypothetical protein
MERRDYWLKERVRISSEYEEVFQEIKKLLALGHRPKDKILLPLYKRESALEQQSRNVLNHLRLYQGLKEEDKRAALRRLYEEWTQ